MKNLRRGFWPLAAVAAVAAFSVWAGTRPSWVGWPGGELAACYPGCFCEAFRGGGFVQPLSAYSNLFYILAGLLILATRGLPEGEARDNRMTRRRGYIAGYGAAVIFIGATSFFFHVTLTQIGRWLDYLGMYAFAGYALVYGMARLRRWNDAAFLAVYALILAACGALWFAVPDVRRPLLGGLIFGIILVEAAAHGMRRPAHIRAGWLAAALAVFAAALAVNLADEAGLLCAPGSLWQWHLLWHFLTAAATVLLYVYYRSESE